MGNRHPTPPGEDDGSFPTIARSQTIAPNQKGKMNKQRTIKSSNKHKRPPIGVVASTDSVEVGPAATMETIFSGDVEVGYDTTNISPTNGGVGGGGNGTSYGICSPPSTYSQVNHRKYDSDDSGSVFESIDDSTRNRQTAAPPVKDKREAHYKDEANRKRRGFILLSILLLAVVIAIAIIVPLSKNKNRDLGPTEAPTSAPTYSDSRLGKILETIGKPWISDTHEEGYPNNPYAVDAIDWLVYNDPAQLPVDGSVPSEVIRERYVMALLYYTTNGTQWINQDNVLSETSICDWYGVNCTTTTAKNAKGETVEYPTITHLDLEGENAFVGNQLSGSIPFAIAALSNLKRLNLDRNTITGTVPTSFGNLKDLEELTLGSRTDDGIRGPIPTELGDLSKLTVLQISPNFLEGSIPTELGRATNLEAVMLRANLLTGTLPNEIFSLTKLKTLDVGINQLEGTIPSNIKKLSHLELCFLFLNDFEGGLPSEMSDFENLNKLHIYGTQLAMDLDASGFCNRDEMIEELIADCGGDTPEVTCVTPDCCDCRSEDGK